MSRTEISNAFDLYNFLRTNNAKLVMTSPFPWSPGHMTQELDYFLRLRYMKEIDPQTLCLLIYQEAEIPATYVRQYAHLFTPETKNIAVINNNMTLMAREIALAMPELTIDVSLSHSKFSLKDRSTARLSPFQNHLHFVTTNHACWRGLFSAIELRSRCPEYQPLAAGPEPDDNLRRLLNDDWQKIALVHRRNVTGNAAVVSDPSQFFLSLSYFRDNGYKIIFISREPCPPEFTHFGVINYAQSPAANFHNDLALFKNAKLAIVSGAGIGSLAEIFDTPLVWTNGWMLIGQFATRCSVWLPAMIRYKGNGRLLKFIEQFQLLWNRPEGWDMPPDSLSGPGGGNPQSFIYGFDDYSLRLPEGNELLDAVREVEALTRHWVPPTPLQKRLNNLAPASGMQYLPGRLSQPFAEKFADALIPGFA